MTNQVEFVAPTLKRDWETGHRGDPADTKVTWKIYQDPLAEDAIIAEVNEMAEGLPELIGNIYGENESTLSLPQDLASYQGEVAVKIRKYAVDGFLPDLADHEFLDFLAFVKASRLSYELYGGAVPTRCEHIFAMAILRARLDDALKREIPKTVLLEPDSDHFSLFEIAVLAHMHEKAVRNATQANASDSLNTFKDGSSTLVTAKDANDWLIHRREFSPTMTRQDVLNQEKGVLPMHMKQRYTDDFFFIHESGDKLYPIRMTNRDSGRKAFRLSMGGNKKSDMIEIDDPEDALKMVEDGYGIRCQTTTKDRTGIYSKNGWSVKLHKRKK